MDVREEEIVNYFEDELGQVQVHSPSTDNLFSNRDVLARRLQCRLEREDLIVRGILPSHHASPQITAQIHQLERAKTGDILQKKIRVRASRQQLVQRHILADSKIDASLQGKQSSLERRRIADSLNEQLFNRPGPLELIRENILKVEPNFDDAVKHGCVPFNPTCRDVSTSPVSISFLDSPSSEIDGSRCSIESLSPIAPDSIDTFTQAFSEHVTVDTACGGSSISDAVNELEDCIISTNFQKEHSRSDRSKECLGRKPSKSNKKKQQCQSKPKIKKYKYHEYKPPGTVVPPTYQAPLDDRYKRLLEQQQMFLQVQVMKQNALFAAINGTIEDPLKDRMDMEENQTQLIETTPMPTPPTTSGMHFQSCAGSALDELRVTELKSELRQRGLPVSGSKAKLLERLRDYQGRKNVDDETNSQSENVQSSPSFTTSVAETDVHDAMTEKASSSQAGNGFIKVTTYAAQNGETFQLVQAVPNSQSELQYQLVPTSVMLGQGQSVMHPVPVQQVGLQHAQKGAHIVQMSASTADNSLLQNAVHAVVSGHDPSVITETRQYMGEPISQVSQPVQLQLSPSCSSAVSADSLLELSSAIERSQKAVLDAFTLQALNEQVKSAAKSQASMHTQTSREPVRTGNISYNDHSSLLNQLQKMQLPPHAQGDYHQPVGTPQEEKADQVTQHTAVASQNQLGTSRSNRMGMNSNINLSSSYSGKPSAFFTGSNNNRGRAQTDPLATNTSTCTSLSFRTEAQRRGQSSQNSPLLAFDGCDSKLVRRDPRTYSVPSVLSDLTSNKSESQASEDLLDILGEISGSSMQHSNINSLQAAAFADATRSFSENLHYSVPVKHELNSQRSACSKSKTLYPNNTLHPVANRPYGSLPGDLNLLGGDLPCENQTVSAHRSYSNIISKSSTGSLNYSMEPQPLNLSPLQIGDDMDVDSESCFSPANDLDWLNLNHIPNTASSGKRQYDRNQSSGVDTFGLSVMASNLYENTKSHEPLSIFDLESSHSLVMAVDGHESDKWDF